MGNWPVRWKVVAIVALPLVLATVFGGFRISAALNDAQVHFARANYWAALDIGYDIIKQGSRTVTLGFNIRNLFDKPDLRDLADALNDDIRSAIARGILPNVDPGYLIAALSGVVFEVSVVMTSRNPVNPEEAAEFATCILMGGIDKLPRKA